MAKWLSLVNTLLFERLSQVIMRTNHSVLGLDQHW